MATAKQRSTAQRNLKKARKTNQRKSTVRGRVSNKVRRGVRSVRQKVTGRRSRA